MGKAALLGNLVQVSESNLDSSGYLYHVPHHFFPYSWRASAANAAGVLDFSTLASYRIRPNVQIRTGYQMLYIGGLALAPGQPRPREHLGGVFLHGPMAGFEVTW